MAKLWMMKNKKIVMIGPSINSKGGIASVVLNYMDAGLFDKFSIDYLASHVEGGKFTKLWVALSTGLNFVYLLLTGQVAFLHAHVARWNSFWRKSVFMLLCHLFSRPYIIHIHSGGFIAFYENDCNDFQRKLINFFLKHAAKVIVLTNETSRWALSVSHHNKVEVLANFIQQDVNSNKVKAREKGRVLFLGRFTEEKGIYDLLEVLPDLLVKIPEIKLILCGEGDSDSVNEKIASLEMKDHVELLGWVTGDDKLKELYSAQVFVLPSFVEGVPMGVLEAMQSGCPVVATTVGGIPDQIENGVQGILYEAGDQRALRVAMEAVLTDVVLAERMGQQGMLTIKRKFSAAAVMPKLESIYKTLSM